MKETLLKQSHEDLFLEQGWLLALGFFEGWVGFRIQHKQWANLEPFSLGTVSALSNLTAYNEIKDSDGRRYLEPYENGVIYHTFWGVTPPAARIKGQYPPRKDVGSMLNVDRTESDDVGYVNGYQSPFWGPFSKKTEIITVAERYPAYQVYNPLNDSMYNVMMNFDQRQYTYEIIKDKALLKDMLIGGVRVKKYTMGIAYPQPMNIPKWLSDLMGKELLTYTKDVMGGKE